MSSWSYLLSGKVEYTRKQLSGIDTVGNGCLLHSLSRTSLDTHSRVFKGKLGGYSFGNSWHSQLILVLFVLDNPPRQNDSSSNCNRVFVFLYTWNVIYSVIQQYSDILHILLKTFRFQKLSATNLLAIVQIYVIDGRTHLKLLIGHAFHVQTTEKK